ncbi:MAG: exo-alpha-sialidase [Pirellulales bacterium]|nr:exo-alpha-sialidase [Pirellulales bacterium]
MRLEETGLVYDAAAQNANRRVAAFTALCTLESGTAFCSFSVGPQKHAVTSTVKICRSRDRGRTWETLPFEFCTQIDGVPGSIGPGEMVEVEPGRLAMFATWFDRSEPDRPLFDPETEGILHSKQLLAFSDDKGDSWSDWTVVPTPGLTGCAGTGPVLKWSDGMIGYPFESYKEFDDPSPSRHGAWLLLSRDGCRTFDEPLLVAQHPEHSVYYWDQRLCLNGKSGGYIGLFWTHDLAAKRDLSVHIREADITRHYGKPGGADFEVAPIRATTIPGQIAAPLLLQDGRLLAFVVDRDMPGTMKLWQSLDGGRTWPENDALTIYTHDERAAVTQGKDDIDFGEYWDDMTKWSFGHPSVRGLPDGRVLAAFYAGTPQCMDIHWARVAP